ncbi:hypothetical protein TanjilG_17480 [Lupinus angustifolius]|uniref:Protein kinase domain-containing protein n=1 Tax=Lupinus angustifolius TaxID=3871 RepID=A0A4P1R1X6_LUPAN|nr:hypothetical protein TanjilG_17480 [Lupinus angustifolius]
MGYVYLSCKAESTVSTSNSLSQSSKQNKDKTINIQHFHYSDLEAATNGFSEQMLLGKGSHGYVYKAILSGKHVAVKRSSTHHSIHPPRPHTNYSTSHSITNELDNEIEILSKIQSPRLVNLVGFTNDSKDRLLVVEFMSNGTLYDVLHSSSNKSKIPCWGRRIRFALETAKAIDTLHSSTPPVIHRDIKSANVLIDQNYNARIPPPKNPIVRKQLAVIAAKCVRSCRERRPSMNEIVNWLCGLCKLMPLHSWNGFNINNPCMMVEPVGRPIEAGNNAAQAQWSSRLEGMVEGGNNLDAVDAKLSKSATRYSRRVYSDLGLSNNLMDLMAATEDNDFVRDVDGVEHGSKSGKKVSSSTRFGSGRYFTKGSTRHLYRPCRSDKDTFVLSKGQIIDESETLKHENGVCGLKLNSMEAEVIV